MPTRSPHPLSVASLAMTAALALSSFAPALAVTAPDAGTTASREVRLGVTFTPRDTTPLVRSEIVGELDLHLLPGGDISGYYRPEADRSEIPLTGGRTASGTFLDVGSGFEPFHIDGTLVEATPAGSSLMGTARIRGQIYDVQATSCQTPRGEVSILCQ